MQLTCFLQIYFCPGLFFIPFVSFSLIYNGFEIGVKGLGSWIGLLGLGFSVEGVWCLCCGVFLVFHCFLLSIAMVNTFSLHLLKLSSMLHCENYRLTSQADVISRPIISTHSKFLLHHCGATKTLELIEMITTLFIFKQHIVRMLIRLFTHFISLHA